MVQLDIKWHYQGAICEELSDSVYYLLHIRLLLDARQNKRARKVTCLCISLRGVNLWQNHQEEHPTPTANPHPSLPILAARTAMSEEGLASLLALCIHYHGARVNRSTQAKIMVGFSITTDKRLGKPHASNRKPRTTTVRLSQKTN